MPFRRNAHTSLLSIHLTEQKREEGKKKKQTKKSTTKFERYLTKSFNEDNDLKSQFYKSSFGKSNTSGQLLDVLFILHRLINTYNIFKDSRPTSSSSAFIYLPEN